MIKNIGLFIILLFVTACGAGRDVAVVTYHNARNPKIVKNYVIVADGDNLYGISTKNKVSIAELVTLNGIKPPFNLNVGQKVYLPKTKRHKVRRGDTLYSLARKYGVNVSEIAQINNFSKRTKLNINGVINIPKTIKEIKNIVPLGNQIQSNSVVGTDKNVIKTTKNIVSNNKNRIKVRKIVKLSNVKAQQKARMKRKVSSKTPKMAGKFIYPVHGKVISGFGRKTEGISNDGINISAKKGVSVKASENGVVVYAGNGLKNFGNIILIKHDKSYVTVYAHLNDIKVSRGDVVKQGTSIGSVGNTGNVKNSQLHFQIRKRRQILNPKNILDNMK